MTDQDDHNQHPRPLMKRKRTADYIKEKFGIPISSAQLDKLAVTGKGPPFIVIGRDALYEPDDADVWACALRDSAIKGASTSARARGLVKHKGRPKKGHTKAELAAAAAAARSTPL